MRFLRAMGKIRSKTDGNGMKVFTNQELDEYLNDLSPMVNLAHFNKLMRDPKIPASRKKDVLDFACDEADRFTSGDERFVVHTVRRYWNKYGRRR